MKRSPLKQVKPLLVVKLEKAFAKYAAVRDSKPAVAAAAATAAAAAAAAGAASCTAITTTTTPPTADEKPNVIPPPPLSPTKKLELEKKLKASLHNYHKFLKMATNTLSEREIGMCPAEVITEIRSRKQKVRISEERKNARVRVRACEI